MRLKVTPVCMLLLAAAAAAVAAASDQGKLQPATADKAQKYIDAMKELSELLGKGFENAKLLSEGLPGLLGTVSKVVGIVNVLFGLPSSQSKQLQSYFEEVNRNFQKVFIQMDEVKRLISWESARGKYADDEKNILAMRLYYGRYLSDPDDQDYEEKFVEEYDRRQGAATNLYLGVVEEDPVLLDNLADAAMAFTKMNRRLTTDFLMGLLRLVLEGSMMDILYYRLTGRNADLREAQWDEKLETLMRKIDSTDAHLVASFKSQANKDIDEILKVHGGQDEGSLGKTLHNSLKAKFYWKKWCIITSKKTNGDNYYFSSRGRADTNHWRKNSNNKRIEITSYDPATLNMNAVSGAVNDVSKKAYSTYVVSNMNSYFRSGLSKRGESSSSYNYAIRALCGGCRLHAAGDGGQTHSQKFTSFWYIIIPAALDGTIAAC